MPKKVPKIGNATNVHDDDEKKGHRKKKSKAVVVFDQSDLSKLIPNGVRMWCHRDNLYRRVEILDNRKKDGEASANCSLLSLLVADYRCTFASSSRVEPALLPSWSKARSGKPMRWTRAAAVRTRRTTNGRTTFTTSTGIAGESLPSPPTLTSIASLTHCVIVLLSMDEWVSRERLALAPPEEHREVKVAVDPTLVKSDSTAGALESKEGKDAAEPRGAGYGGGGASELMTLLLASLASHVLMVRREQVQVEIQVQVQEQVKGGACKATAAALSILTRVIAGRFARARQLLVGRCLFPHSIASISSATSPTTDLKAHEEATKVKNIEQIVFGKFNIHTWYRICSCCLCNQALNAELSGIVVCLQVLQPIS
jgi:hypothetical protein